jgi:hypothetical protein
MTHIFDVDIAKEYGVDIAIVVNNIAFWLQKNKANNKHVYDGKVWTYNTTKAFTELFPYWTYNQIRRILDNMQKAGIIEIGNYNATAYDRTKWYTFTDAFVKTHTSICENTQMDLAENPNGFGESNEPIPDNKPVDKQDSKPKRESRFCKPTVLEVSEYCKERGNNVNPSAFVAFYDSKGWMIGKNKMKDWRGAVRTWEQRDKKPNRVQGNDVSPELQAKGVFRIENGKYYTEKGTEFDPFKEQGECPF